jgi:hypothetical protein
MTHDEIIEMAIEAKLPHYWESGDEIVYIERVTHFAKLVEEHVRKKINDESVVYLQELQKNFDAESLSLGIGYMFGDKR